MSKSIKLKGDNYIDSSNITHDGHYERLFLDKFFNGTQITDANQLLTKNSVIFFSVSQNITLLDVTIPIYTKGILLPVQSSDACVIAVDSSGYLYIAFRNGNKGWISARKI